MALDKETEERIEQPVSEEAEREIRLTPDQAVRLDAGSGGLRHYFGFLAGCFGKCRRCNV